LLFSNLFSNSISSVKSFPLEIEPAKASVEKLLPENLASNSGVEPKKIDLPDFNK
jgi:hypothetical protein